MTRQINNAALALIEAEEGCELTAYQDVAGIWTIGYGHTPAQRGQSITQAYADELLKQDLSLAEMAVDDAAHDVMTSDNQFGAMVSLAYNIGVGAFRSSSVLRLHRQGSFPRAADAFLLWDKAHVDGELVVVEGLLSRREKERTLYLNA